VWDVELCPYMLLYGYVSLLLVVDLLLLGKELLVLGEEMLNQSWINWLSILSPMQWGIGWYGSLIEGKKQSLAICSSVALWLCSYNIVGIEYSSIEYFWGARRWVETVAAFVRLFKDYLKPWDWNFIEILVLLTRIEVLMWQALMLM